MKNLILILACVLMCGCDCPKDEKPKLLKVTLYSSNGDAIKTYRNVNSIRFYENNWRLFIGDNQICIQGTMLSEPETASEKE